MRIPDSEKLRERLHEFFNMRPRCSVHGVSVCMGISHITLTRFLHGSKAYRHTLLKIERFLDERVIVTRNESFSKKQNEDK